MKHFRLTLIAAIALLSILSGAFVTAIFYRNIPMALLIAIFWLVGAIWMFVIMRRPLKIVNSFAKAIDEADTTAQIPLSDDPELRELATTMNKLAIVYGDALRSIEARKHYYDRILRIMTHEMRNSIAPVISLSTDLVERTDSYDKTDIAEAASLILSQSKGIKKFLDSYYELTHLPQPEMAQVDGTSFFSNIRKIAQAHAGEHNIPDTALSFTIARKLRFTADADLLSRAVINLLRNSIEATEHSPEPAISVTASVINHSLTIKVTDNGHGIAASDADNLFMPFFSTKKGGSGIGLCLSRQIARLHGGDLNLLSSGRGATAILTLPLSSPSQ